jgi:hypothetical protein
MTASRRRFTNVACRARPCAGITRAAGEAPRLLAPLVVPLQRFARHRAVAGAGTASSVFLGSMGVEKSAADRVGKFHSRAAGRRARAVDQACRRAR